MSTLLVPAIFGFVAFLIGIVGRYVVIFCYRLKTGKTPKDARRNLDGLDLGPIENALRASPLTPPAAVSFYQNIDTSECSEFTLQLSGIMERSGWHAGGIGSGYPGGYVKGVRIELPIGGNAGLEYLGKKLNGWGYTTEVLLGSGAHATISVGEPF